MILKPFRYLGNVHTMEVHDLENEKARCNIAKMLQQHKVHFYTLEEAHVRGFADCKFCIGSSEKRAP